MHVIGRTVMRPYADCISYSVISSKQASPPPPKPPSPMTWSYTARWRARHDSLSCCETMTVGLY